MKAAPHVRANVTNDGVVLLDIKSGEIFSANIVAARIWERLLAGDAQTAIVESLAAEFDIPRTVIEQDVREFVESLCARALVTDAAEA